MRFKLMLAVAAPALLGGCVTPVDPAFGEALRYDMAIQTINPDPVYPEGSAQPGSNGAVGAAAAERYRKGTVKTVETLGTNSSSSGSSSGSGSGPN